MSVCVSVCAHTPTFLCMILEGIPICTSEYDVCEEVESIGDM